MLDKPAGLARVMRVVGSEEKPPSGFSWGDFEDMDASVQVDDEDGWSSVPTRLRKSMYEDWILNWFKLILLSQKIPLAARQLTPECLRR